MTGRGGPGWGLACMNLQGRRDILYLAPAGCIAIGGPGENLIAVAEDRDGRWN